MVRLIKLTLCLVATFIGLIIMPGCTEKPVLTNTAKPDQPAFMIVEGNTVELDLSKLFTSNEAVTLFNDLTGEGKQFEGGKADELFQIIRPVKLKAHPDPQPTARAGYVWGIHGARANLTLWGDGNLSVDLKNKDNIWTLWNFILTKADDDTLKKAFAEFMTQK